jgi:hypothetical protein
MDLKAMAQQMAALTAALPEMQKQLKEAAVREAVDGGAMVRVVPEWFPRPVRAEAGSGGNVDPWFGLTQADWVAEMKAGFSGWMQTTEGSGRPKVLINYEAAREWLQQKWQRQRERRLA